MRPGLTILIVLFLACPAAALEVTANTVWQGEKAFTETVRVLPEVTLTVAPGTRVSFAGAGLEVAGTLVANDAEFSGKQWDGLLLKGNDAGTKLSGCRIEGAKTGITVKGGAPVLEKLELVGNAVGIELRGKAGGSVSGATFTGNEKVGLFVKDDSTTAISGCRFEKNGHYGAYLYHARPGRFATNGFYDNPVALMIAYHGSDPMIEANHFEGNEVAIQVDRAAKPVLKGNLLLKNGTGLYAYRRSDPVVTGNRLEGNDVGVLVAYSSYPQVTGNDFVDNRLAMKLEFQSSTWESRRGEQARAGETATRTAFGGQGMRSVTEADRRATTLDGTVNAQNNWWGAANTSELTEIGAAGNPSFIHDGSDQATFVDDGEEFPLDKVTFAPWSETAVTEIKR